jgi:hypothetical protein
MYGCLFQLFFVVGIHYQREIDGINAVETIYKRIIYTVTTLCDEIFTSGNIYDKNVAVIIYPLDIYNFRMSRWIPKNS